MQIIYIYCKIKKKTTIKRNMKYLLITSISKDTPREKLLYAGNRYLEEDIFSSFTAM